MGIGNVKSSSLMNHQLIDGSWELGLEERDHRVR
ncbi:hypothetical protein GA0115259_110415 [Streptomyces sp. MnatMP-M17]|nr:hypothetical protein GA0115259_110415 [Streptomyces sp. MnatMP-M17]